MSRQTADAMSIHVHILDTMSSDTLTLTSATRACEISCCHKDLTGNSVRVCSPTHLLLVHTPREAIYWLEALEPDFFRVIQLHAIPPSKQSQQRTHLHLGEQHPKANPWPLHIGKRMDANRALLSLPQP